MFVNTLFSYSLTIYSGYFEQLESQAIMGGHCFNRLYNHPDFCFILLRFKSDCTWR